jgi:hypothetical protein
VLILAAAFALAVALEALPVAAEEPVPPEALEAPAETSVRDVLDAPPPDQADNITVPDAPTLRERLLWIPRVALFVPWVVTELAFVPVRTLAYGLVRFQVGTRVARLPFNDTGRAAAYPILALETGYGADAGLVLIGRDLLGAGERAVGELRVGHRVAERYHLVLDTGHRLGPVALLGGSLYQLEQAAFHGIGPNQLQDEDEVSRPVDPLGADGVESRYGLRTLRAYGGATVTLPADLTFTAMGGRVSQELRETDGPEPGLGIYDTSALAGVDALDHYELTAGLTLDARSGRHTARPGVYPDGGVLVQASVTRALELPAPAADYTRVHAEVTGWASVLGGGRVASARVGFEAVTGEVDQVPFYELPALGGPGSMRGLRRDRFRDRAAAMIGAEYRFLIEDEVALAAFVDAGAVADSPGDLGAGGIAVGFGLELSVFGQRSDYLRAQVGSSTEGELVLALILTPEVP